jgi:hypothetical protein
MDVLRVGGALPTTGGAGGATAKILTCPGRSDDTVRKRPMTPHML